MIGLNSKFIYFLFTVQYNDSLWNIEVDFDEWNWKEKVLWCTIQLLPNHVFY